MAASFPDFRWTLTKVTQTGVSIDLDVLYTESTTGFSQHQNVHIQDGSTATTASVVAAIRRAGDAAQGCTRGRGYALPVYR